MPRKAMEVEMEADKRAANFQQIVGLAEKLMDSLVKKARRAQDVLK